jgi:chromosome segregation ATPase
MRMFSKFLVFTNLVISLVFLGWTLSLFILRIDWAPHKNLITGEVTTESGRLHEMEKEIKQLVESRDMAEKRWMTDSGNLQKLEDRRLEYKDWYADRLQLAKTGKDMQGRPPKGPPVVQLIRDPQDELQMLDIKNPKALKSRDLEVKSVAEYEDDYRKLKDQLDIIQGEIDKLVDENTRLTKLIAGDPGKTKGVRAELVDLLSYKKNFDDEMLILKPLLVQQRINVEQQKRRLAELQGRLKELQGANAALRGN